MAGGASQPRRTLDGWQEFAKQRGHKGLAYVLVGEDGELGGPVAKNLTDAERDGLAARVGAKPGDCIFFSAGSAKAGRALLGRDPHRDRQAAGPASTRQRWAFTWVVDWPMFEPADDATASGRRRGRLRRLDRRAPRVHRTPGRSRRAPSTPTPARRWPTPTTSSATATRSVAARSVSTAATSRSGCSP